MEKKGRRGKRTASQAARQDESPFPRLGAGSPACGRRGKGERVLGNIESYLTWRGDLTFQERPFCEVDNLVLSELAYLDLAGIVPPKGENARISVQEAARLFYR